MNKKSNIISSDIIKPDKIERSKRKTISLVISSEGVLTVKMPNRMTLKQLDEFVLKNQAWIRKHRDKKQAENNRFADLFSLKKVMIEGREYEAVLSNEVKAVSLSNETLKLPLSKALKSDGGERLEKIIQGLIAKWLKREAEKALDSMLRQASERLCVNFLGLKLINSKGKWGACNRGALISLNWRAIMLPKELTEYIIVHELMHLKEMNHSKSFWAHVGKVMPDYKTRRKALKEYAVLQRLYR